MIKCKKQKYAVWEIVFDCVNETEKKENNRFYGEENIKKFLRDYGK